MSMTSDQERNAKHSGKTRRGESGAFVGDDSRRDFLKVAGAVGLWTATLGLGGGVVGAPGEARARNWQPPLYGPSRRVEAFRIRTRAARIHLQERVRNQRTNGDETRYADLRASFSKGLPHNSLGEVDPSAFDALVAAMRSGDPDGFEAILLSPEAERKLANPQGAFAFDMMGRDSHATKTPPAPRFTGAEVAAEMGEVYWQALTREVPFVDYETDPLIAAAVADLNNFSSSAAPTEGGVITPGTLFRGGFPGDLVGPYVSQFLWMDVPYGPSTIVQRYSVPVARDFMTDYDEWLAIQRGAAPVASIQFDPTQRYIYDGRALGEYVRTDVLFQAYFNASLIIARFGPDALDRSNPYLGSETQGGFVTFGGPHVFDMVSKAARVALEGAWYHKWQVHRRLRAEMFSGRIENQMTGHKDYQVNPEILDSDALQRVRQANGTALLPQAFPEGSPTHPSYPAGHATVAGACATVLKAFFDEDFVIPDPVEASVDGDALVPWTGEPLTLGGEINKLASNINIARCTAGVHYRSDGNGLQVGEAQALGILQDYSLTHNEDFAGFTLTTFAGERIRIANGKVLSAW